MGPSNQTVPVNTITSFFCRARGSNAKWFINNTSVDVEYDNETYADKGITFTETPESSHDGIHTYNLTITVMVSVAINTTKFICVAYKDTPSFSEPAQLIVMGKS